MRGGFRANGEVQIASASIAGYLDCSTAQIDNPGATTLMSEHAYIGGNAILDSGFKSIGEVRLLSARIGGQLSCSGGSFENPDGVALSADGAKIESDLFLHSAFRAEGQVRIPGVQIGGQLVCSDGQFSNHGGISLNAQDVKVRNSVILGDGFHADGEVRLLGARIGNGLICSGGTFENPGCIAFTADGAHIRGQLALDNSFKCCGETRLVGVHITGSMRCAAGTFHNPQGNALTLDYSNIDGAVFLRNGFLARGVVRLPGATIGSDLDCAGARIENTAPSSDALILDRVVIRGDLSLAGEFCSVGAVRLLGAQISGKLVCSAGSFNNPEGIALSADGAVVSDSVLLGPRFRSNGMVRFQAARVGHDFICSGGTFNHPNQQALIADRINVRDNALLDKGFLSFGEVSFGGADISGQLVFTNATIINPDQLAIVLQNVTADSLWIRGPNLKIVGAIDLRSARVRILADEPNVLSDNDDFRGLDLDGFVYDDISPDVTSNVNTRLQWLALQTQGYHPQPFDQLAGVLRRNGQDHEAREVLIAKRRARRPTLPGAPNRGWDRFLDFSVLYGWQPWRPLAGGALILLYVVGLVIAAQAAGLLKGPPDGAGSFHPFAFVLDSFLPFVDLGIESDWTIDTYNGGSFAWLVISHLWFLKIVGWSTITLAAAAVTGLVKRD